MSEAKGSDAQFNYLISIVGMIVGVAILFAIYQKILIFAWHYHTHVRIVWVASLILSVLLITAYGWNKIVEFTLEKNEPARPDQIRVGIIDKTEIPLYADEETRTYHTQVIGSTGSGKTEGITLPWIFDDIESGRGLIIVDGKPEEQFLKRVYGKVVERGRAGDFLLFSLAKPTQSHSFNPLAYGDSTEIAERIFSSFSTDSSHYGSLQFTGLNTVLKLIHMAGRIPKPGLVRELLRNKGLLSAWTNQVNDPNLYAELQNLLSLTPEKYQENFSGLLAYFENFTNGPTAPLLNQDRSEINFEEVLLTKKIVYFQLPTLLSPTLASVLGKLAVQSFASSVGKLQASGALNPKKLFSLYLDDFNDYIYEEFSSVTSKVRSGGVGIVFAHQSLADLDKVSPEFREAIIENTNNKIILNINDPNSAEFFSKYIGTVAAEKMTERRTKTLFGHEDTGEQSVRTVEEFIIHPNIFKSQFKALEGIAILKSPNDVKRIERIRCVPVKSTLQMLPPNRTYPSIQFVAEAKMFGEKKDAPPPTQAQTPKPPVHRKAKANRRNENEESKQVT